MLWVGFWVWETSTTRREKMTPDRPALINKHINNEIQRVMNEREREKRIYLQLLFL